MIVAPCRLLAWSLHDRWMPKPQGHRLALVDPPTRRPVRPVQRQVQVHAADGRPLTARDTSVDLGPGGSDVMQQLQASVAWRSAEAR